MPIFQLDTSVFDSDHCADVAALYVFDDQAQLGRMLCRAWLAPSSGENIGSVAIVHPAILGTLWEDQG